MALSKACSGVFIVAAKRTAFGSFGGKLKDISAEDLGVAASKAALDSAKISPDLINSIVFGNVILVSSTDGIYMPRHIGLKLGVPVPVPALGVSRLCGSGLQVIITASQEIELGLSPIVLCGGTENMSRTPYAIRGIRFGPQFGQDLIMEDMLWVGLTDTYPKVTMGLTAENLAEKYKITRQDADQFVVLTQTRWQEAQKAGKFNDEIAPIKVKGKKGLEDFAVDEHPRVTTMEALEKLPPVFKKGGTGTAGNSSGISDGASALVMASEAAVKANNLNPLARLVSYSIAGCDPTIMGIGPALASKAALAAAGKTVQDMDVVDVNDTFATQFLAVSKELGLDPAKTNVNGGAIALGHPLAASGVRIVTGLVHELRRSKLKYAMGSIAVGGGQGIAVILERV